MNPRAYLAAFMVLLAAAMSPRRAGAQVGIERLQRDPLKSGVHGALEGSVSVTSGNANVLDVGGTALALVQTLQGRSSDEPPGVWDDPSTPVPYLDDRVLIIGNVRYGEALGVRTVSNGFAHVRAVTMWHPLVGSETFAQLQFNDFQRLQVRYLGGLGARFDVVHERSALVWAGTGLMLEYERLDGAGVPGERIFGRDLRSTSYVSARFEVGKGALLTQTVAYFQPRVDEPSDLRFLLESFADVKIYGDLSGGLQFSVLHDSRPPAGIRPTDTRLVHTLKLEL